MFDQKNKSGPVPLFPALKSIALAGSDVFAQEENVIEAAFTKVVLAKVAEKLKKETPLVVVKTAEFKAALLLFPLISFQVVPEPG
jgi:hypothetical protein